MRYSCKKAFLEDIETEYARLEELLADLTPEQMVRPGVCSKWSVKDILAHLNEWHLMALDWYAIGLTGTRAAIPAMKDIRPLNRKIYEKHKDRTLKQVRSSFEDSHRKMLKLIESLSEKQLLTPGYFPWMRKNAVITYLSPNMASHYRWAMGHIRKWKKRELAE